MMSSKLRKGDSVVVIKGKDKGKKGKVLTIDKRYDKAVVDGVNMYKRHVAPKQGEPGGIKEVESAISLSNLSIEDPKDGKPTKVGFKLLEDGKKVRFSKRSGEVIDG